ATHFRPFLAAVYSGNLYFNCRPRGMPPRNLNSLWVANPSTPCQHHG
ncbi:hypothetical protein LEMLEM_LOCUS15109, partial [Lemmus lemmus]